MVWPVDAALAAGLASRSQQRVCRADVLRGGVPVITGLRVTAGNVIVSGSQANRRTCNVTAIDVNGDLAAANATDSLSPYGDEIALYRGLHVGGVDDLVPVGVFRINSSNTTWTGGQVSVAVTGTDRSIEVSSDLLAGYSSSPSGTLATTAILDLVSGSLPAGQRYSFAPLTQTIAAQAYAPGDDPWAAALTIAANAGCLLYFDAAGTLVLTPVPDPTTVNPAWTFTTGQASILSSAGNTLDRNAGAANVIVAISSGSTVDVPLYATAEDDDPGSPTWVGGSFGRQVRVVYTNLLLTTPALQTYANTQLALSLGATETAQLTSITLPQLDAFDVVEVDVAPVGLASRYVIDQLSIPLGAGLMSLTTRGLVV